MPNKDANKGDARRWIMIIALFVALAAGLWYPAHNERTALQQRIDKAQQELGVDLAATSGLSQLEMQVRQMKQQMSGAQRYIPQQDEMSEVLRSLTTALSNQGVQQREVVAGTPRHDANYSATPITLEFESDFHAAYQVLREMESLPRLMRVEQFRLQANVRQPTGRLRVHLQLSAFFASQQEDGR